MAKKKVTKKKTIKKKTVKKKETIGGLVKAYRLKEKYTVQEMADHMGVSKGYVSLIESGKRVPSTPVMIQKFSKKLNKPVGKIVEVLSGSM